MFEFVLGYWDEAALVVTGLCLGGAAALRYIAPLTDTKLDDKALGYLELAGAWLAKRFRPRA